MIVKSSEADRIAKNPPKGLAAALLYGPDQGLARERGETLAKTVVDDLSDPFRVADLDEQTLSNDPARLSDEVALNIGAGEKLVGIEILDAKEVLGSGKIPAVILEGLESAAAPLTLREKPPENYGSPSETPPSTE